MKKTIIILILFFAVFSAKAQTIYDVLENQNLNYFQKVEQIETIKDDANKGLTEIDSAILKRYDRYVTFWDSRIDENGSTLSFVNAMKNYTENRQNQVSVNWDNFGPRYAKYNGHPAIGLVRSIEVVIDGSDTTIFAGSNNGGLWKSTDGGTSYHQITPDIWGGIMRIIIHPTDKDTMLIITGIYSNGLLASGKYGTGCYRSYDGGDTWESVLPFEAEEMVYMKDITFDPINPNTIYAVSLSKVHKSTDLGNTWTETTVSGQKDFYEIDINPANTQQKMISGGCLMKWDNTNNQWISIWDNLLTYLPTNSTNIRTGVSVYNNEFYILVFYKIRGSEKNKFLKTSDYGLSFDELSSLYLSARSYILDFEMSPSGVFYGGGLSMKKSNPDYLIFSSINTGLHSDIRDICFPDPSNPDLVYVATDGGIGMTKNGDQPWKNISGDLALNEIYSVGISEQNPDLFFTGQHDNGTHKLDTSGTWKHVEGSDGGTCLISNIFSSDSIVFVTAGSSVICALKRSTDGGDSFSNVSTVYKHDAPILQHPFSPNIFYKGYWNIQKSTDGG